MPEYRSASGSVAEDLFIDLFADTFGAEKAGYLYSQYPFYDIYLRQADTVGSGATLTRTGNDHNGHSPLFLSAYILLSGLLGSG